MSVPFLKVAVHVFVYVGIWVCIYMYVYIYVGVYAILYVCMYVHGNVCMHMCFLCMNVGMGIGRIGPERNGLEGGGGNVDGGVDL